MSDTDPASSRPDTPGETDAGSAPPPASADRPTPPAPNPPPQYNPTPNPISSSPESPDEPVPTAPTPVASPPYQPAPESAPAPPASASPTPNPAPVYSPTPATPVTAPPSAPSSPATTDTAPAPESAPASGSSGTGAPEQAPVRLGSAGDDDDGDDDSGSDGDDDSDDDDDEDWDEVPARDQQALRWVGMVTSVGVGIVSVIALQVLISLYEGLSFKAGERIQSADFPGVTDDLLHRIGYAFAGLGTTSQIFLILAVVLISLPPVLGGRLTDKQYRNTGIALRVATVLAITVAVGTLLWVRASLNEYSVKDVAVPRFVRIEYTNALLGTLTASALAIFASLTAHPLREWDR